MRDLKGLFFRDWANDYISEIIKEVFIEKIYDPFVTKGNTVLDIGANVGIVTFWAYRFASKIWSVEPSEEHFDTLMHMIAFNKMEDKVIPVRCAISGENKKALLYHNDNTTMYSLADVVQKKDDVPEEVEAWTLKKLFDEQKIDTVDFMKTDVEGEEFRIFSSDEFTELAPRIKTVAVEWHSWTAINPEQLKNLFIDNGYRVSRLETGATVFLAQR